VFKRHKYVKSINKNKYNIRYYVIRMIETKEQLEVRETKKKLKLKRYYICANLAKVLEQILLL